MQDFEAKWEKSSGSGWTNKVQSRAGDNKPCSFIVAVKLACYWICSDGRALLGQVTRQSKASINSKGTLSSAGNSKFATQSQAEPDSVFPGKPLTFAAIAIAKLRVTANMIWKVSVRLHQMMSFLMLAELPSQLCPSHPAEP